MLPLFERASTTELKITCNIVYLSGFNAINVQDNQPGAVLVSTIPSIDIL
jgi:hypothetical protein